ncbi:hypothetical protein DPEC_G00220190 [Dallia pectoralis]|uniref:Uncharacterized protein n=1 Tax=Dallia pectoralis TaxID=75939 RepID=A0ACC2G3T6_DALPE|nr:hypothetical protein DPEC_G00220190 [Dallia pectoralis]
MILYQRMPGQRSPRGPVCDNNIQLRIMSPAFISTVIITLCVFAIKGTWVNEGKEGTDNSSSIVLRQDFNNSRSIPSLRQAQDRSLVKNRRSIRYRRTAVLNHWANDHGRYHHENGWWMLINHTVRQVMGHTGPCYVCALMPHSAGGSLPIYPEPVVNTGMLLGLFPELITD